MNKGFTLLELAVVLTIIGLIIGGITAGANLLHNANLQTIIADLNKYKTAVDTFQTQYASLPGDMPDATDYWGTAATCPGTVATPSTDKTTCNGDGDGKIEYFGVATSSEIFRFWQHLVNSELIEGRYTGVPATATANSRVCSEDACPAASIDGALYAVVSYGSRSDADATWWEGDYNNELSLAKPVGSSGGVISPREGSNIDLKLDDGRPAYGNIRTRKSLSCNTTSVNTTAEYLLSNDENDCTLLFLNYIGSSAN